MIEAVVFDFGHTLVDFTLSQELLFAANKESIGLLSGRLATASQLAREQIDEVTLRAERRVEESLFRQDLHELDLLAEFAPCFGNSRSAIPESAVHRVACLERRALSAETHLSPANAQVLRGLRVAGFRLGLVSNITMRGDWVRELLDDLGMLEQLDAVVLSSEERLSKPDSRIYQAIVDRLGTVGHNAVFIGDRIVEDIAGPQSAGMRAVLTREFRREELKPTIAIPDHIIDRLADLPIAVSALRDGLEL